MEKIQRNWVGRTIALGLDVDLQRSTVVALNVANGSIEFESHVPHTEEAWLKVLKRFPGAALWACYEAGNRGFGLCRMLRRLGVDCQVVAPSAMPKSPVQKQTKNDRRDALALAQLYINRPRSFVRVPTEQEEADRQLIRTRTQLVNDRVRVMNEIKSLLNNYSFQPPVGKGNLTWSKGFRAWLKTFDAGYPGLRIALDAKVRQLDFLEAEIKGITAEITALSRTKSYHDRCQRLCQISGVGNLTAMAFLLEVYRPHDFITAEKLASHLGLTQCEYSSGGKVRRGHITHWGPAHLRRLLVEAAWVWVRKDDRARNRYYSIRSGKERKRAIVAMARRLAIAMWAMTVKEQDYDYHWAELPEAA